MSDLSEREQTPQANPKVCTGCSIEFASRNKLFKHLNQGGEVGSFKCPQLDAPDEIHIYIDVSEGWHCSNCTLKNKLEARLCVNCGARWPVAHTRPAGPPHQALASHTYLQLFLFCDEQVLAADHAKYQLVCKVWHQFEDAEWSTNFAPKTAYKWRQRLLDLVPAFQSLSASSVASRDDNNPFDGNKVPAPQADCTRSLFAYTVSLNLGECEQPLLHCCV